MAKGNSVKEGTLIYPEHELSPQDFLHFVQLDEFEDDWKKLGLDDELDLWMLEVSIMSNPDGPPVIPGTGGLRKMRFAPQRWKTGKSGAARVCYVYFKEYWMVLLVMAYGKNEKEDLTESEKSGIKKYIEQSAKWLGERNY